MEKLRTIIAQYSRWKELELYIDRMEGHLESDFSISVENAKALLESVGKEICSQRKVELSATSSVNGVLKNAFTALGYGNTVLVNQVSSALATIGQQLGNLRNEISPTSHGKPLEELRERNNKVDLLTRDFLIDSTILVVIFLIRAFEERYSLETVPSPEIIDSDVEPLAYEDAEEFNSFWDDAFGEFSMNEYSYAASEILYRLDYQAYEAEFSAYQTLMLETKEGTETE